MRNALIASALLAVTALTGCASSNDGSAHLNVHCPANNDQYVATFERALFTESGDGKTDLILLSGEANPAVEGAVANGSEVRQVVHVRVLWQPTRTIRLDSPSAGNAMINWTVIGAGSDRITYSGNCWARVSVDGDEAAIDLREANVSVRQISGTMNDPLRRAKLEGKFVAKRSDAIVHAYLGELSATTKQTASVAVPTPPARAVTP